MLDVVEVSAQEARAWGSGASAAGSSEAASVPYEKRQHEIIANLGWDEAPVELVERSVEILTDAGVPRDSWTHLAPITSKSGQGSSAELWLTRSRVAGALRPRRHPGRHAARCSNLCA